MPGDGTKVVVSNFGDLQESLAAAIPPMVYVANGVTLIGGNPVKFAKIDAAGAGDNTLVAAVVTKKIRVHSLFLVNGDTDTQTVRFESGASGTALTGAMILATNGGFVLPFNEAGWFETIASQLLNLELADAITVDGSLSYSEVG